VREGMLMAQMRNNEKFDSSKNVVDMEEESNIM
jgi:hypothetical protein